MRPSTAPPRRPSTAGHHKPATTSRSDESKKLKAAAIVRLPAADRASQRAHQPVPSDSSARAAREMPRHFLRPRRTTCRKKQVVRLNAPRSALVRHRHSRNPQRASSETATLITTFRLLPHASKTHAATPSVGRSHHGRRCYTVRPTSKKTNTPRCPTRLRHLIYKSKQGSTRHRHNSRRCTRELQIKSI